MVGARLPVVLEIGFFSRSSVVSGRGQEMVDALKGKRAAIIAADDFEDLELFHPNVSPARGGR